MTTATPTPPRPAALPRPQPVGPSAGLAPIDPIRLARQHAPLLVISLILGLCLGVAAHLVLLRLAPVYTSSVVYACSAERGDLIKVDTPNYHQDEFERFMQTQVQMMVSDEIIRQAVLDPGVQRTAWAKPFMSRSGVIDTAGAARDLQKHVASRALHNSQLIRLSMSWRDRESVAVIVNAINRAYLEDMRSQSDRVTADERQALARRLNDTREGIRTLESQRDLIVDGGPETLQTQGSTAAMTMLHLTESLVNIETSISAIQGMLQDYAGMLEGGKVIVYPDRMREQANNEPIVRNIDMEVASLRAEVNSLRLRGYGDQHEMVRAYRALIEGKQQERQREFERVLRQLYDAEVDSMRQQLVSREAQRRGIEQKQEETRKRRDEILALTLRLEQIIAEIETQRKTAAGIEEAMKNLDSRRQLTHASRVRVLRQGQTPTSVTFPKAMVMIPAGAVLLPALIGGIVLLRELFDQRVRGPADIALIPRMRVLGVIPNAAEDPARPANVATAFRDCPGSAVTESFRQLRAPVAKRMDQMGYKSLLVLAGMPASGGSSTVANLALISAASDQKVLVIDANLRRPAQHRTFAVQEGAGLGDVLAGAATLQDAVQGTGVRNLSLLSAGTPANRTLPERLSSESMAALIREASATYDLVIVDAPPAIVSGDGMALANRCDAVLLVVRALAEKRGLVARLQNQLSDTRAELLGVVLNAVRASAGGYFKRNIKATHEYQKAR